MSLCNNMARKDLFWTIVIVLTCAKTLLIPAYHSTDFEVHRNWLAITHSLPISQWYYEATSEWTLDYPPLFAWLEYILSFPASLFDPEMLQVSNLNYSSPQTILFQRLSVILTDFFLVYAVYQFSKFVTKRMPQKEPQDPWSDPYIILSMLMLWNPGLLIVDHIHFQYNGFLNGIMLLSIVRILEGRAVEGTFWFSVLLNLKHIYIYIAPAYFIYLLQSYCFQEDTLTRKREFSLKNFAKLSTVVLLIFGLSFGPFIMMGQMKQVLSRLFPFKRGLTHAYWAPNFWAIYNLADKVLSIGALKLFGYGVKPASAMTGGLVEEFSHNILPSVTPFATLFVTLVSMLPAFWIVWKRSNDPWSFVRAIVLCAFSSFLFGWHVHEKAILLVILPLTPMVVVSYKEAQIFAFLAPVAHFSLLPLLFKPAETPVKILLLLMHSVYIFTTMKQLYSHRGSIISNVLPFLNRLESAYVIGLFSVQAFYSFGANLSGIEARFPFLPLMVISVYCSIAVIVSWLRLSKQVLKSSGRGTDEVDSLINGKKYS